MPASTSGRRLAARVFFSQSVLLASNPHPTASIRPRVKAFTPPHQPTCCLLGHQPLTANHIGGL